jgi:hypothetical protein
MRGSTKEAAGRIIEEETENGVHCRPRRLGPAEIVRA